MYAVSEEYLQTIRKQTVTVNWYGNIKTVNGVNYYFDPSTIRSGSGKITRQICTTENIEIGTTCSSELDISLYMSDVERYALYKGTVTLFFQLLTPSGWESVPLGIFIIAEPPERNLDVVTIHAYDNMLKFNENFGSTLTGTPYQLLEYACKACNVELGNTPEEIANYVNGEVVTYNFEELEIYTWRDMVGYIAAYLCCFAFIGVDGKLYLKPYGMEPDRTIDENWRYTYKPKDYETFYTSLSAYFAITQEYEQVILSGLGLDYDLGTNPFIQFNADNLRKGVLTNIITELAKISYTPFTATFPCDPSLMPGDVLNFTGNHAVDGKLSAITKQIININGAMEIECVGTDPNLNVLTETEKQINNAARNSNKDAIYYYDFASTGEATIGDGETARIIFFEYTTTKETHVDFHGEVKALVETTETYDEATDTYTENDGLLSFTYRQGGEEVTEYYPVDSHFDGIELIHLLYTWWASGNILSVFEVWVKCTGCSLTIDLGCSRGYIAGVGLVGDNAWDGSVRIYEDFEPIDFGTIHKDFTDDAEGVVSNLERSAFAQNIKRRNFFDTVFKTFTDSIVAESMHRFTPAYNDDNVTKVNVVRDGDVWKNIDIGAEGTLTTYNCEVERILRVTSANTGNNGSVSYIVSFDDGRTWYTYSSGFVRWTGGDGMFASILPTITESEWAAWFGTTGFIKVRAIITGDATLESIEILTEQASTWTTIGVDDVASYDESSVKIADDTIQLITSGFVFEGEDMTIDDGHAQSVTVDPTGFSAIQSIEVSDRLDGILDDSARDINTWTSGLTNWQKTIRYENGVNEVSVLGVSSVYEDFELAVEVEPETDYELQFGFNAPNGYSPLNLESRRAYVWNSTWTFSNGQIDLTDNRLLGYTEAWRTTASEEPIPYTARFNSGGNSIIRIQFGIADLPDNAWTTLVWRDIKLIKVE